MLGVMSSNAVYVIIYVVYKFVLPWSGSGISIMSLLPMFSQHMTGYSFFDTISQCECGCVYVNEYMWVSVRFVSSLKTVHGCCC